MSASRNLGIAHAQGEFIAFLDSDDVWLPEKLEHQVQLLLDHPEAGLVCGPSLLWFSWTGKPDDASLDFMREIGVAPDTLYTSPSLVSLLPLDQAKTPAICSVLIRKSVFAIAGGFVETFRGMFEDQAFLTKVLLKAPVFVTSKCWDRYRQHSASCCATSIKNGHYNPYAPNSAHARFLFWLAGYLAEEQVQDSRILEPLNKALWPYRHPFLHRLKQFQTQPKVETVRLLSQTLRLTLPNSVYVRLRDRWQRICWP